MSVAIIVDTFPRWSERFIARELNELLRRGIDFKIYCLRAGDADCERDPEFADLVSLRVVLPSCFLPSFARNMGLDDAAKERMRLVESELGVTAFRQIGCAHSLTKIIREQRHTIVYAHFASLPSTLGWLAAAALNLPFVLSCHARDVFVDAQLLQQKIEYARRVFTCNKLALQVFKSRDEQCTKIRYMPHGLPLERFVFSVRRERSSLGNLKLLSAGRLVPKKGFHNLIDALASQELKEAAIELTIVGDGPERKALLKRVERLGLSAVVTMPGVVLDARLQSYFESVDAFVMPSVETGDGDSDGLPNVVLEAFAIGVPVIGTDAGSLTDVLDATTGFVASVSPTPVRQLALTIREVLMESERAAERALHARSVVQERYDIRKNIEPLITELTQP